MRLPVPPEGTSITDLIEGRPWLFENENYHTDVSHLAAIVRMSLLMTDPEPIRLALELTDYGRHLAERFQYESDPLFEKLYEGHGLYLQTLLGQEVEASLAYFRSRLPLPDHIGDAAETVPAQLLIRLLERLGRLDEAIDLADTYLVNVSDAQLICSPPSQLCRRAGRLDRLAQLARRRGNLVEYAAAILQGSDKAVS